LMQVSAICASVSNRDPVSAAVSARTQADPSVRLYGRARER